MARGRPSPLVIEKVKEIVKKRAEKTVDLANTNGPESPLTP